LGGGIGGEISAGKETTNREKAPGGFFASWIKVAHRRPGKGQVTKGGA